jgi:hypothetical protein
VTWSNWRTVSVTARVLMDCAPMLSGALRLKGIGWRKGDSSHPARKAAFLSTLAQAACADARQVTRISQTLVNTPVRRVTKSADNACAGLRPVYADETFSDAYGNCVAVWNKGGSPRVMLAARTKSPDGELCGQGRFLYVRKLGGVDDCRRAQRVVIHTQKGPVKGVIGNVAPTRPRTTGTANRSDQRFIDIKGERKAAEAGSRG